MGTWGPGSLENDSASDWVYDLEESNGLPFLAETLQEAANSQEYLESTDAELAVAAAETLACLLGRPGTHLTESLEKWVADHPQEVPADLVQTALKALERIVRPPSELLELWEESDFASWQTALDDLRRRLQGA